MIQSIINPSIKYNENKHIEKDDKDMDATPYEISFENIDNLTHIITFGNMNIIESKPKIAYFHMYLVINDKIASQIGIIEFLFDKLLEFKDEDGDLDSDKLPQPIFFSFVNDKFLKSIYNKNQENYDSNNFKIHIDNDSKNISEKDLNIEEINDDDDAIFTVPIKSSQKNPQINSVFEIDNKKPLPQNLYEETKQESIDIRKSYRLASHHEWIQKFMKNIHYDIIDNEGSGDCLFAVIRDAFQQINRYTSVQKLRELIANEMNDEIFHNYRSIYLDFENYIFQNNKNIKELNNIIKESKRRYALANNQEKSVLLENIKKYTNDIKQIKKEK